MDQILGLSLRAQDLGFGQMAARAALIYVALLVIVRSGKKRFLGRASAFDVVLVITLGSIAARAVTGNAPLFTSMLALVVLVAVHWIFSAIARDSRMFGRLIKGHSTVLVRDGVIDKRALRAAHMSRDDLEEDLREKSVADLAQVAEARLERSGRLSAVKKTERLELRPTVATDCNSS
jgi:uncharacterized membrane protein YcaP (DUF421 family)